MMKPRKEETDWGTVAKRQSIINSPFSAISDKWPIIHGLPVPGPWRKPGTCLLITRPNINLTS